MQALVTGATGFLGSRIASVLADRGYDLRVLARASSDRRRLAGLEVDYALGDVTDRSSVQDALDGVDVVFHCAAFVDMRGPDQTKMHDVNVGGTRHVLESAASRDVLAVYVSSVAALGPTGPEQQDETWWNPRAPSVAYEATKREAHLLAHGLIDDGARVRIGIPGGIYGADDESSMSDLIRMFVNHPTPLGYMPELVQSLVNVDDCADGLVRIADHGADGEQYLLCADAVTFRRWFELIAAGAGRRPPVAYLPTKAVRWSSKPASTITRWCGGNGDMVADTIELATRHQNFSGERMRKELGWAPRTLGQGMVEMAAVIRAEADRKRADRRASRRRT